MPIPQHTIVEVSPSEALAELRQILQGEAKRTARYVAGGTLAESDRTRKLARIQFAADVLQECIKRNSPLVTRRTVEVSA